MATSANIRHILYKSPTTVVDPGSAGTIIIDKDGGVCHVITLTAEARTLQTPTKSGIRGSVVLYTDGGDLTLTVTGGYNNDADTSITFGDAGDFVSFMSINVGGTYYWRVTAQEGTNVGSEDITVDQITTTTATINKMAFSTFTAVAAANSAINNATLLSYGFNVVSAADSTKAVILPVATAGMVVWVASPVANVALPVFPQVNSTIGGAAANAVCTLAAGICGAGGIFVADNTTHWCVFGEIA